MDYDELKEKLEVLNLQDLSVVIGTGLELLFNKLKEEGFGDTIGITGFIQHSYANVVVTDIDGMNPGDVNHNYQTFRIL